MPTVDLRLPTERLDVFLPRPEDAARVAAYHRRNREHLAPWEPRRPVEFFTDAFWNRQIAAARTEFEAGTSARTVFTLRDEPDGPIVGLANLTQIHRGPFQAAYLGYSLDSERQGRGYMREALRALLDHAFGELRLHRVMANYRPENERSGRVLEALGFLREGFARSYLHIDGAWRDHVLTALVSPRDAPPGE